MKFKTHPHLSDHLWLSLEDMAKIQKGETLKISALNISLEKDDVIRELCLGLEYGAIFVENSKEPNVKFTFDGETGKLKSAEVL